MRTQNAATVYPNANDERDAFTRVVCDIHYEGDKVYGYIRYHWHTTKVESLAAYGIHWSAASWVIVDEDVFMGTEIELDGFEDVPTKAESSGNLDWEIELEDYKQMLEIRKNAAE